MHFGTDVFGNPAERERRFVRWLDFIRNDVKALYLLGDVFDFWFEYKNCVPQGFTRFLGKIAELSDDGVEIHYFTGNHDVWIFDYLERETGVVVHREPLATQICGKNFFLAHGDGLGDNSRSFKIIRSMFHSRFCQRLFGMIHPSVGIWLAHKWAKHSRMKEFVNPVAYLGEDREHLVLFAKNYIKRFPATDFLVFGHRHIILDIMLSRQSRMLILGDWLQYFSYAVFDGENILIEQFISDQASSAKS